MTVPVAVMGAEEAVFSTVANAEAQESLLSPGTTRTCNCKDNYLNFRTNSGLFSRAPETISEGWVVKYIIPFLCRIPISFPSIVCAH